MTPLDKYLEPITPEAPCGQPSAAEALGTQLFSLENLVNWTPATDEESEKEPNWEAVENACYHLLDGTTRLTADGSQTLGATRHLSVLTILCLVLLRQQGLTGFQDGLALLRGLIERHWLHLFPLIDPKDESSPNRRINLLRRLAFPANAETPYRFVRMLREIPLTDSARFGKHSYKDIVAARTAPSGSRPPGDKTPSMAQVTAAFGDTKPDVTSRNHQAVQTILDHVTAIQGAVGAQIGNPQALNLKDLVDTLRGMEQCLREFSGTATGETKVQTGSGQTPAPERGAEVVNGREDVLAALDKICVYYDRYEPGSPVPFLLRRARQWVNLDFMQIMQDLAPSSLEALKAAFGKPKDVKDKGS